METPSSLPYHEPSLVELLIPSTFLLALSIVNSVLDRILACGLVGQVLVGTAWGVPGAGWLSSGFQKAVSDLGYLGLILLVYEGGLETDVGALKKNFVLSVAVALTGVLVPIALSFALFAPDGPFLGVGGSASSLQAFAAGAALCSTSLGTTFSVLQASGLSRTRLGAVLSSAALLDDVVGLVMVRIITSLGKKGSSGIEPAIILRPVLVSIAFAIVVPLACRYLMKPGRRAMDYLTQKRQSDGAEEENDGIKASKARIATWLHSHEARFVVQTALLISAVVAADYAGASVLLAAYLAGVVVSWWDESAHVSGDGRLPQRPAEDMTAESHHTQPQPPASPTQSGPGLCDDEPKESGRPANNCSRTADPVSPTQARPATEAFGKFYEQLVHRLLKPFFFASIGFSIPISRLFTADIVWRGLVYGVLMVLGKLVCGLWLVRFPGFEPGVLQRLVSTVTSRSRYQYIASRVRAGGFGAKPRSRSRDDQSLRPAVAEPTSTAQSRFRNPNPTPNSTSQSSAVQAGPPKPLSLYPSAIMGCAMVARGEIGFLISSTAESEGIFHRADEQASKASELFLVISWAIFLCTILGPVCTGLIVQRIKKLERASVAVGAGRRSVLGVWGEGWAK
ncbi:Sodium/hydrogen exchanger [Poronia punctata]|nr:Sodium/hydrogen exchanger [Poronia punctata]